MRDRSLFFVPGLQPTLAFPCSLPRAGRWCSAFLAYSRLRQDRRRRFGITVWSFREVENVLAKIPFLPFLASRTIVPEESDVLTRGVFASLSLSTRGFSAFFSFPYVELASLFFPVRSLRFGSPCCDRRIFLSSSLHLRMNVVPFTLCFFVLVSCVGV